MPNEKSVEMRLPSLDDLFSSQEERDDAKLKRIYDIDLLDIDPFPDHPFKVQDDEDMINLAESIRMNGVLTPATVRKKEDGRYELLSAQSLWSKATFREPRFSRVRKPLLIR